ncbi:hypothetical protein [Hyphomicrobium sp. ghe19]|uniref:hypothetical protein n=1 Tax=Hyphomicrobium sp. ghe19 TaxID=2682968 RepID=UPI001366A82C|nr:hypothetical protein HYPP_02498 [Hyphomicrobium sp. ghe19]
MRIALVSLALAIATPAVADQFDPMPLDQQQAALPLQRKLAQCWMTATNKPYETITDVKALIDETPKQCGTIAVELKAVLGTGRMEAFISDLTAATYATHAGALDDENSVPQDNCVPSKTEAHTLDCN